jgi:hypothetical protein
MGNQGMMGPGSGEVDNAEVGERSFLTGVSLVFSPG